MTTKTDIEAMSEVIRITENFRKMLDHTDKMTDTISDVRFADFMLLFLRMQTRNYNVKLLFHPEFMVIRYEVIEGCIIYIYCEECKALKPKINLINYN